MGVLFLDRISKRLVENPEIQDTLVGRWIIAPVLENEVLMNSVPVTEYDYLVPDSSGFWCITENGNQILGGKVSLSQFPADTEDIEMKSILAIGEHLNELEELEATRDMWAEVTPLVPGISEEVEISALERMIREYFGHLEAVCVKPKAHLQVEIERVRVSRARRVPKKAAAYLASHTEDWERPLLRGVVPKRVLSEMRYDQIDIYENRVTVHLINNLSEYLDKRIKKVNKLLRLFQDKENYSNEAVGTYRRRKRILDLWGESIDTNEGRRRAEETLKELEWLRYRLMGLMDSQLFREVPRRSYIPSTLRMTNILSNDQHYKRVADLWMEWTGAVNVKKEGIKEFYYRAQGICRSIDRFALLVSIRSIEQLGYVASSGDEQVPVIQGGSLKYTGYSIDIDLCWEEDGTISLKTETDCITILPLAIDLSNAKSDDCARSEIEALLSGEGRERKTLVLYIASEEGHGSNLTEETQRRVKTVGNDPRTGMPGTLGIIPISPWDIGSVERVARAIRWFLDSERYNVYPPSIRIPDVVLGSVKEMDGGDWLSMADDGASITMKRAPKEYEWKKLKIEKSVEEAKKRFDEAKREHELASEKLKEAVRKGNTHTLNQQKKAAHKRCVSTENELREIERLEEQLQLARKQNEALLICPVCGEITDEFEPRGNCFKCYCAGCHASWESRLCSSEHKYAAILPGGNLETDDTSIGWEERMYGSDMLALPARRTDGFWGFRCPVCGEVT